MEYKRLKDAEKDEILNDFLLAQERDHHCHTINAERYRKILGDSSLPDGEFKERVKKLLLETLERLREIELIIKHTEE